MLRRASSSRNSVATSTETDIARPSGPGVELPTYHRFVSVAKGQEIRSRAESLRDGHLPERVGDLRPAQDDQRPDSDGNARNATQASRKHHYDAGGDRPGPAAERL